LKSTRVWKTLLISFYVLKMNKKEEKPGRVLGVRPGLPVYCLLLVVVGAAAILTADPALTVPTVTGTDSLIGVNPAIPSSDHRPTLETGESSVEASQALIAPATPSLLISQPVLPGLHPASPAHNIQGEENQAGRQENQPEKNPPGRQFSPERSAGHGVHRIRDPEARRALDGDRQLEEPVAAVLLVDRIPCGIRPHKGADRERVHRRPPELGDVIQHHLRFLQALGVKPEVSPLGDGESTAVPERVPSRIQRDLGDQGSRREGGDLRDLAAASREGDEGREGPNTVEHFAAFLREIPRKKVNR